MIRGLVIAKGGPWGEFPNNMIGTQRGNRFCCCWRYARMYGLFQYEIVATMSHTNAMRLTFIVIIVNECLTSIDGDSHGSTRLAVFPKVFIHWPYWWLLLKTKHSPLLFYNLMQNGVPFLSLSNVRFNVFFIPV